MGLQGVQGSRAGARCFPLAVLPPQDRAQQHQRHTFIQRLVIVASLGGVDAARTPGPARALRDDLESRAPQPFYDLVSVLGYAHASRMAVVDEDLWPPRVWVKRSRYAANVPAVAQCKER